MVKIILLMMPFYILSAQNSLEAQMKELERLQQQLKSLQTDSGVNQEGEELKKHHSFETQIDSLDKTGRFQLFPIEYKDYNPQLNKHTGFKSIMKMDTYTGIVWIYIVSGSEGYWKLTKHLEY